MLKLVWGKQGGWRQGKEANEVCGWVHVLVSVCEECSLPFLTASGCVNVSAAQYSFTLSLLLSCGLYPFTMALRSNQEHQTKGKESSPC